MTEDNSWKESSPSFSEAGENPHAALTKTEKINPYAVTHDVEFTYETDVEAVETKLDKHFKDCSKNPGHQGFIPIESFSLDHLQSFPMEHRQDVLELVRAQAELTVRIRVFHTSMARPDSFPETTEDVLFPYYEPGGAYPYKDWAGSGWSRVGTGYVWQVERGGQWRIHVDDEEQDEWSDDMSGTCRCRPTCQAQNWAKLEVDTALHLVYDQEEADHTELEFFYNADQDRRERRTRKVRGMNVYTTEIEGDHCDMYCYTHDEALVHRLEQALRRRGETEAKLCIPFRVDPVLIVSHPHGCGKVVTTGEVTQQKGGAYLPLSLYTAPSCPGSSGAPVLWWMKPEMPGRQEPVLYCSPHSGFLTVAGKVLGRCGQLV